VFPFSSEEVAEILRLLDATSHDELTLETDRLHVVFRRGAAGGWTQETRTLRTGQIILLKHADEPGQDVAPAGDFEDQGDADAVEIRSPLPGTFYRAPKPGAAPFVEVGSHVRQHSVIAIVETMKLMN
jgi:acetyl-CoA carboxylase biotin carboxyl carrier protein